MKLPTVSYDNALLMETILCGQRSLNVVKRVGEGSVEDFERVLILHQSIMEETVHTMVIQWRFFPVILDTVLLMVA